VIASIVQCSMAGVWFKYPNLSHRDHVSRKRRSSFWWH